MADPTDVPNRPSIDEQLNREAVADLWATIQTAKEAQTKLAALFGFAQAWGTLVEDRDTDRAERECDEAAAAALSFGIQEFPDEAPLRAAIRREILFPKY